MTKSRAQIRAEFAHRGHSITGCAKAEGFTPITVKAILNDNEVSPGLKCLRGEAHDIAVEPKPKVGEVSRPLAS